MKKTAKTNSKTTGTLVITGMGRGYVVTPMGNRIPCHIRDLGNGDIDVNITQADIDEATSVEKRK
jgi:hypothetical protein